MAGCRPAPAPALWGHIDILQTGPGPAPRGPRPPVPGIAGVHGARRMGRAAIFDLFYSDLRAER